MSDIYQTLEFDDDAAGSTANDFLEKGWALLHVGTKLIDTLENGQAYYNTAYVVGATKSQWDQYQKEISEGPSIEEQLLGPSDED